MWWCIAYVVNHPFPRKTLATFKYYVPDFSQTHKKKFEKPWILNYKMH